MPATSDRVEQSSPSGLNAAVYASTISSLTRVLSKNDSVDSVLEGINRRLCQLDREWDMERTVEFNASTLIVISGILGMVHSPRWFFLAIGVAVFLLQHAIQGWCPPVPIFRYLNGSRTMTEISTEKVALKLLRGHFLGVDPISKSSLASIRENSTETITRLLEQADLHQQRDRAIQPSQF